MDAIETESASRCLLIRRLKYYMMGSSVRSHFLYDL